MTTTTARPTAVATPCPPWCTTHLPIGDEGATIIHNSSEACFGDAHGPLEGVTVSLVADPQDENYWPPRVYLNGDYPELTLEDARQLALHILDLVAIAQTPAWG